MTSLLLVIIYIAFISLGLPDALLGSAWPTMYTELGAPLSYAGIISMIIAIGTVISSLLSDRLTKKLGAGRVTAISVGVTALALFGFSKCTNFYMLCIMAIPYGLGAGSVDAALNNYVALHYASRHMSWLHSMWGVGTIIGPNIMGLVLTRGASWRKGYGIISLMQIVLTAALILSLPLWKKKAASNSGEKPNKANENKKVLSLPEIFKIKGAKEVVVAFFCYCAAEQTALLWGGSYMVLHNGISKDEAASLASLFCIGITAGRIISGFLTYRLSDKTIIRLGQGTLLLGCIILFLPFGKTLTFIGLALFGLGCAPIYPCIIHSTPAHFGEDKSQALVGVQMAFAYIGTCLAPPLFGIIANHISVKLFPLYLILISAAMIIAHELLLKKTEK